MEAAFQANILICGEKFRASVSGGENGIVLAAGWKNEKHHAMDLQDLAKELGALLPDFLDFRLELETICIRYDAKKTILMLNIAAYNKWNIIFGADISGEKFFFYLKPAVELKLNKLPLLGEYLGEDCYLRLSDLAMVYEKKKTDKNSAKINYLLESSLLGQIYRFGSETQELPVALDDIQKVLEEKEESLSHQSEVEEGGWITVKKQLGPCYLRRMKASFEDGNIVVALDAGTTVSMLTLDFLELQVKIALGKSFKPTFGLKGLCAAVVKPPLFLSGGLYYEKENERYTGELTIRYQQFTFLGLGSYQAPAGKGKSAFFAYLFVGYAFGGPPSFYITGLAAGFGVNQKIKVPAIQNVPEFPFIRAAQGKEAGKDAGAMLSALGQDIVSQEGSNFLTAGVRFTSFGMVESIVLLNVEFGQKFEVSLLGLAKMDLPPKSTHPIVHGTLALQAIFCPEDGCLQIEGALMRDAYLFSENCHMTGGFAFYSWFSGEHAGDFVLTVGGYHPLFRKKSYYPSVNRVGIDWKISDELNLSGEAYFALVPACLMAGGKLNLDYHMGNLKAWCHLAADFLIQWNPFYYDISASASIGASYRLDALFIHHTFTLELSASMHLWGPEFAGEIRIKWHIISFTIRFHTNSKRGADFICWKEFQDHFLDKNEGDIKLSEGQGFPSVKVGISQGKLKEKDGIYYMDAADGAIRIESQFPCKELLINEKDALTKKEEMMEQPIGVVPMGIENLKTSLHLEFEKEAENGAWEYVDARGKTMFSDMPSALWDPDLCDIKKMDMNRGMMSHILRGYCLKTEIVYGVALPEQPQSCYSMQTLLENEKYTCEAQTVWHEVNCLPQQEPGQVEYLKMYQNDVRNAWLSQISETYGVYEPEEVDMEQFAEHAEELLFAPFYYKRL